MSEHFIALQMNGPPAWLALPVVFALVATILAGPAELVGRRFARLSPLAAYRYDLIGSLGGILLHHARASCGRLLWCGV